MLKAPPPFSSRLCVSGLSCAPQQQSACEVGCRSRLSTMDIGPSSCSMLSYIWRGMSCSLYIFVFSKWHHFFLSGLFSISLITLAASLGHSLDTGRGTLAEALSVLHQMGRSCPRSYRKREEQRIEKGNGDGGNREERLGLRWRVGYMARTGSPSWGGVEDLALSSCSGRRVGARPDPCLGDGSRSS